MGRAGKPGTEKETQGPGLSKQVGTDEHLEHMEVIGGGVPMGWLICPELICEWDATSMKIPPRFVFWFWFWWRKLDKPMMKYIWKNK